MYCERCGSASSQDAHFCQSCGKPQTRPQSQWSPTVTHVPIARTVQPEQKLNPKAFWLIISGIVLAVIVGAMLSSDSTDKPTSTKTQQSSAPIATQQSQAVRPSTPPPKFRIYKFRNDDFSPTSIVVSVATSDEQLRSLLWFFREKVRAHDFKSIGIPPQNDGIFSIYRGEKCANEAFLNAIGPCGYGEHEDADYQWGIEGDYNKDEGSIRKGDVLVFDYKDGWQVSSEVQSRLEEQDKLAQADRDLFAQQLQQRLTSMGYEITVWVHHGEGADRGHELNLDSEMFKDTNTRVEFISSVLPAWRKDLCKAGFRTVRLRQGGTFELGQDYSLGCGNS